MMQAKRIVITGGKGFLGSHLLKKFEERDYTQVYSADHAEYDFVKITDVQRMYAERFVVPPLGGLPR